MGLDQTEEFTTASPVAAQSDNPVLESGPTPEVGWSLDKGVTRETNEDAPLSPLTRPVRRRRNHRCLRCCRRDGWAGSRRGRQQTRRSYGGAAIDGGCG
jgi:hypothetical protein